MLIFMFNFWASKHQESQLVLQLKIDGPPPNHVISLFNSSFSWRFMRSIPPLLHHVPHFFCTCSRFAISLEFISSYELIRMSQAMVMDNNGLEMSRWSSISGCGGWGLPNRRSTEASLVCWAVFSRAASLSGPAQHQPALCESSCLLSPLMFFSLGFLQSRKILLCV